MGTSGSRTSEHGPSGDEWAAARGAVTRLTNDTGGTVARAVGNHARALRLKRRRAPGGSSQVSTGGVVRSSQRLAHVLRTAAVDGLDEALREAGIGRLVGASGQDVLSGIIDYAAGPGATLDETIARSATVWLLCEVLGGEDLSYDEMREQWEDALSAPRVEQLLALFLARYIFEKFLSDLGERIEANALSDQQAARIETEAWRYIRDLVAFDAGEANLLELDWQGRDGRRLVERNLEAALRLLEARMP